MTTGDHFRNAAISTINLKDAKAGFSSLVDAAVKGEFITITRHGKPVAALVSLEAVEIARKAIAHNRVGRTQSRRSCRLPQNLSRR